MPGCILCIQLDSWASEAQPSTWLVAQHATDRVACLTSCARTDTTIAAALRRVSVEAKRAPCS